MLTIEYPRDTQPDIDSKVNVFIGTVSQWLGLARADIDSFNSRLEHDARAAIEGRRQRIAHRNAHLAQSSIPERRYGESGQKTYIAGRLGWRGESGGGVAYVVAIALVPVEPWLALVAYGAVRCRLNRWMYFR